jgi:hypothetical protein
VAASDKEFARHPELLRRRRSWPRTILFLALTLGAVLYLVYTIVNFTQLQDQAANATGSLRFVMGQRLGILISPVFLVLVITASIVAAVRWGRVWSMAATGTRLRKRHWRGLSGGRRLFDDLGARLRTGDPSTFTPLPKAPSFADVDVEFWTADADRVGFGMLVLHEGKTLTYSEPILFTGASYDALSSALSNGLDERALPTGSDGAVAFSPATESTTLPVAATGDIDYVARYDPAVAERYLARNRTTSAVLYAIGLTSLSACAAIVLLGGGLTRLSAIVAIFGLAVTLGTLPVIVSVRTKLRRVHAGNGVFARVSSDGVSFGLLDKIGWTEIFAVVAFDDTERVDRIRRLPLIGWGVVVSRRAGNGAKVLCLALRDGSAVQARIRDDRERGFVRLWGPRNDTARKGDIAVLLDPLLDSRGAVALTEAITAAAALHGLPTHRPRTQAEYIRTLGRLLDPKWPPGA